MSCADMSADTIADEQGPRCPSLSIEISSWPKGRSASPWLSSPDSTTTHDPVWYSIARSIERDGTSTASPQFTQRARPSTCQTAWMLQDGQETAAGVVVSFI